MKSSILHSGLLLLSLGIILSMPSLVLDASNTKIETSGQAISFITGNFITNLKDTGTQPGSIVESIPNLLVIIGIILIILYFAFRFFII